MSVKTRMSSFICFGLCLGVVCLTITNRTLKVATAGDGQQTKVATRSPELNQSRSIWSMSYAATNILGPPQGAPGEKTVNQTRKNIQHLKGLPESQLFPLMNFVATSLGVQCTFCHVQKGKDPKTGFTNWVWESDDKPEKVYSFVAARR